MFFRVELEDADESEIVSEIKVKYFVFTETQGLA